MTVVLPDGATLGPGVKPILWAVHDECICDSCGGRKSPWVEEGHPPMQPKRGESAMIIAFLTPYGVTPADYVVMEPGKNKDGYWCNRVLIEQLETWLPTLEGRFPCFQIVIQFGNSGNHGFFAPDALIASRLNLSDGYPDLTESDKAAGIQRAAFIRSGLMALVLRTGSRSCTPMALWIRRILHALHTRGLKQY